MRIVAILFVVACAGPPMRVSAGCRNVYDSCVRNCGKNPVVAGQEGDSRGMPVEPGDDRTFNSDTAAESCLTSCRGATRNCESNRGVNAPVMPASAPSPSS